MNNKSPPVALNHETPSIVIAAHSFEQLLHANTFGPGSQYAFNKFRHEQIREEMLDSAIYESIEDIEIANSSG